MLQNSSQKDECTIPTIFSFFFELEFDDSAAQAVAARSPRISLVWEILRKRINRLQCNRYEQC